MPLVKDFYDIDISCLRKNATISGYGSMDFKAYIFYTQVKLKDMRELSVNQIHWLDRIEYQQNYNYLDSIELDYDSIHDFDK